MAAITFLPGYENAEDIYEVEKIVDSEFRHGEYLYRVRWKGCPREQDTWEPEENLLTCDDLLKSYKKERENKRQKRKEKQRKEKLARNEFILNMPSSHKVKVKDEGFDFASDFDEPVPSKKDTSIEIPSSDFDEIDLSGLTRKQRKAIEKVIVQSRKEAELVSPTSTCSTSTSCIPDDKEIENFKQDTECSSLKGLSRKKKKMVIDESSDSEDEHVSGEPQIKSTVEKQVESKDVENRSQLFSEKSILDLLAESTDEICDEDVEENKGKKPSEILENIFGSPKKTNSFQCPLSPVISSPSLPVSSVINSTTVPVSPFITNSVNPLCPSKDSDYGDGGDQQLTKNSQVNSEQNYVSLLDQLQNQMWMDASSESYHDSNSQLNNNTSSSCTESTEQNSEKLDTVKTHVILHKKKEKIQPPKSNVTGIPSSSTLKLDAGKTKQTYMKGVENIRNTLAMKRKLMNTEEGNKGKKVKEDSKSNRPITQSVGTETAIDQGNANRNMDKLKCSLSDRGNLKIRHIMPTIKVSSNKEGERSSKIDLQKSNLMCKHNSSSSNFHTELKTSSKGENLLKISGKKFEKGTPKCPGQKQVGKTTNPRLPNPPNSSKSILKRVPEQHKQISFQRSLSTPLPTTMKMSRSEKLLNDMKAANKLSLNDYKAKRGLKHNVHPVSVPNIFEFTKIPKSPKVPNKKVSFNNSEDKVILPPKSKLPRERQSGYEIKEKGPKPNQIATKTDMIGNIMECFKQPLGRDSKNEIDLKKGSPDIPPSEKAIIPIVSENRDLNFDDLDEYSEDDDDIQNGSKPSHLNLKHANTTTINDLLIVYQVILRGEIDKLIQCSIPLDKINAYVDEADTLIMKAVVHCSYNAAQILLEKQADPNKPSNSGPRKGKTPLMVAVEMNQKSMIILLIKNHAWMNMQTMSGETALIMAMKNGHVEIVHILLNSGVDIKPATTYLEKRVSDVPQNLLPELKRTLQNHSKRLTEITETFLDDLMNARNTNLGQLIMPLRCVSPDEINDHEFYFKCNINGLEPQTHILMLTLPVEFKRNGRVYVDVTVPNNGVKNVYLNDERMFSTSPNSSFLYFLFPKFGVINTLRIEGGTKCKHKLLVCIYSMSFVEKMGQRSALSRKMLIQAAMGPLSV